jgi:predicted ArsR family transcriptional regulator
VRRWLNQGVAEGLIERSVSERTGKPGRPAHLWQLTAKGKERGRDLPGTKDMLTELQARRAHALMSKGMSEKRAIAAVTKGWTRPRDDTAIRDAAMGG